VFTKGRLLYGLDRARKPIRAADQAVIVEGYLDVIALHQAGYENVVSPMGTALTEEQLRLLKRFTRKIVLALDPDTAGQSGAAAWRRAAGDGPRKASWVRRAACCGTKRCGGSTMAPCRTGLTRMRS
jgi:DNA primase